MKRSKLKTAIEYAYELVMQDKESRSSITIASILIHILSLSPPLFVVILLQRYVTHGRFSTLVGLTSAVIAAVLFERKLRYIRQHFFLHINEKYQKEAENKWLKQFNDLSFYALMQVPNQIKKNWEQQLRQMKATLNANTLTQLWDTPFALFYVFIIMLIEPVIGLVISLFIFMGYRKINRQLESQIVTFRACQPSELERARLAHTIIGQYEFSSVDDQHRLGTNWEHHGEKVLENRLKLQSMQADIQILSMSLISMMTVFIYAYGSYSVVMGQFNIALLIAINIIANKAVAPLIRMPVTIQDVIELKQQLENQNTIKKLPKENTGIIPKSFNGLVTFQALDFSYNSNKPFLKNLSFQLKPNRSTIILSKSGGGKTTLCRILSRQLVPKKGMCIIDDTDIVDIDSNWWKQQFTYMGKETCWTSGTIAGDIDKPNEHKKKSDKLLQILDLEDLMANKRDLLEKPIEYAISYLTKSEYQRLCLTKQLMNAKKVIVLDDPFVNLDSNHIDAVINLIKYFRNLGHTIIVCSQIIDNIKSFDHQYRLDEM